jgi:hypothetical protein
MRNSILTACCLLTASLQVHAQEEEDTEMEASPGETEGAEVVDTPDAKPAKPGVVKTVPGARDAAPGETHTVARGDTLWDLSQQYLGSAWYWPKVWAYNPEIANPHWIYPGNQVRFYPSGEEGPSRIDVSQADGSSGGEGSDLQSEDSTLIDGGESSDLVSSEEDEGTVQVSGPIGYKPKGNTQRVVSEGFVTTREVEEAGSIKGSFAEHAMLTFLDEVYVTFKAKGVGRVGDRYMIFRPNGSVSHPRKGGRVGYITKLLGTMRVVKLHEKMVTAKIDQAWDEITRGDLVGPYGEKVGVQVSARPNRTDMEAVVVAALTPDQTFYGEHHIIIVDKGSKDGVEPGNSFTVVRQGDRGGDFLNPSEGNDKNYPLEDVGTCLALDVKETASTCILTRSLREIVTGDRLQMRAGNAPVAAR